MTIDRSMFVLRNGPVGWAVAWSGWRRARAGGVVEKLVEIELVLVEELCAAGRLSCGPTSAADFCTYASNRRIRHETILLNLCLSTAID